jgi:hypothetical protein
VDVGVAAACELGAAPLGQPLGLPDGQVYKSKHAFAAVRRRIAAPAENDLAGVAIADSRLDPSGREALRRNRVQDDLGMFRRIPGRIARERSGRRRWPQSGLCWLSSPVMSDQLPPAPIVSPAAMAATTITQKSFALAQLVDAVPERPDATQDQGGRSARARRFAGDSRHRPGSNRLTCLDPRQKPGGGPTYTGLRKGFPTASAPVRFSFVAGELPAELVEETRSAINRVVGLQLHPSQWSVVDDRLHRIAEATRADDAPTLRSVLHDLTDLSAAADAPRARHGGLQSVQALRFEAPAARPVDALYQSPRMARRGAVPVARWVIVAVVLVLLGVITVLLVSEPAHEVRSGAPPPTSPAAPVDPLEPPLEPAAPFEPPPPVEAPAPSAAPPTSSSHAGVVGFSLLGILVVIVALAFVAVAIHRRRRQGRGAPADTATNRPRPITLLDQPINLKVPSPDEIREYANRLVDTLSAEGGAR